MTRALLDLKPALRLDIRDGAHLRPLLAADVTEAYVDGLNDPEVHRYMEAPRKQRQTLDGVRAYVAANAAPGKDYPLIADSSMKVARAYGMLHDNASTTATVRAVFVIDPKQALYQAELPPARTDCRRHPPP